MVWKGNVLIIQRVTPVKSHSRQLLRQPRFNRLGEGHKLDAVVLEPSHDLNQVLDGAPLSGPARSAYAMEPIRIEPLSACEAVRRTVRTVMSSC